MKRPVVAIGLDAADYSFIQEEFSSGRLPNLRRIFSEGAHAILCRDNDLNAEPTWTSVLTGVRPERTGYWGPIQRVQNGYEIVEGGCYDYEEFPPFFLLGDGVRVAVFDVPQVPDSPGINGWQINAWGAHSPQTRRHSRPAHLLRDIERRHGKHPAFARDHSNWWDSTSVKRLTSQLGVGIERRVAICREWLEREDWDLFITVFGETHPAGHDLWCFDRGHPVHDSVATREPDWNPLREIYARVDRGIGVMRAAAPKDAVLVVFSGVGIGTNGNDIPSMLFLPEILYRHSFPGHSLLISGEPGEDPGPVITDPGWRDWSDAIFWNYLQDDSPITGRMRDALHRLARRPVPRAGCRPGYGHRLLNPYGARAKRRGLYWQPATWYSSLHGRMRAFALPSYSEGYVRINVAGRESSGIVAAKDYAKTCNEIVDLLSELRDSRSGLPAVRQITRTRRSAEQTGTRFPDADIVVRWATEPIDAFDHPVLGRLGPVPFRRTGGHERGGFIAATGAGISPGRQETVGHAVDIAPTILNFLGVPVPERMDGKPLLPRDARLSGKVHD